MDDLLSVVGLVRIFGSRHPTYAVDGVSFRLPPEPTIMSLVGESGSGKTTVARIVLGLLRPTNGGVYYRGQGIFVGAWPRQLRREIQAVFQNPYSAYNPFYRIERIFQVPISKFGLARSRSQARERIEEALRAVDLRPEDVLGRYPHQLSGGQRQRVMLARLYVIRPRLVVADEPVSMVDAAGRVTFLNVLRDFRGRWGTSTLYITHDLSTARYLGGSIMVLYKGRIVESGETAEVTNAPLHPYTQLLIQSVPAPDPTRRWAEVLPALPETATVAPVSRDRCLYAERCTCSMGACWRERPRLRAASQVATACVHDVACHKYV
jgi:peptide/nickel transport system ATP-binding protein